MICNSKIDYSRSNLNYYNIFNTLKYVEQQTSKP